MSKILALAATLSLFGASVAHAAPLMQYDYLDAAYQWRSLETPEPDSSIDNSNGLDSKLSISPVEHLALEGGYNLLKADASIFDVPLDVTIQTFTYGVAGWYDFCSDLHLVGRVGGIHEDATISDSSQSNDGLYAGAQVRYLLTDTIEGDLDALFTDVGDSNTWTYGATALVAVAEHVALKAGVSIDDDSNTSLIGGVRLAM